MASFHPRPEQAPMDDRVLHRKHNTALSHEEKGTCWKLVQKEHKNKVERVGIFPDNKIFGMARRRVNKDGSLGARDCCCVPLQAPNIKLALRGRQQARSWVQFLEQNGFNVHVALAAWPNHWANVLQANSAAKAARKAATEAAKKKRAAAKKKAAAGQVVATMKPKAANDNNDGDNVVVSECTSCVAVWVDEQVRDEMRFQSVGSANCTSLWTH
jgi:hypothetical protein